MRGFLPRDSADRARMFAKAVASDWLDAVTDRRCPGCAGGVARDELVCVDCDASVPRLGIVLCLRCLHGGGGDEDVAPSGGGRGCPRHGSGRLLLAGPPYGPPLDGIIRAFKYEGASHLAPWVASLVPSLATFGDALRREGILVPATLHPARRTSRGFDQALLLSERLAAWWGIPVVPILERTRETEPQARLDSAARRANVDGVYRVRPGAEALAAGRPLLLVDDVATTGATLLAASEALEAARPAWILALAPAHGGHQGPADGGEAAQSASRAKVAPPKGVW